MTELRITFASTSVDLKVDDQTAQEYASRLGDPDAVIVHETDYGTTYIPVRNIIYMQAKQV